MKKFSESQLKRLLKKVGEKKEKKIPPKPDNSPFVTSFLHKIKKKTQNASMLFALVALSPLLMADFSGKCVGVLDGDTVSVIKNGTPIRIRLHGIDCPESSQDFGTKAKNFTANMAFGKNVEVKEQNTDGYGRIVGVVFVDGKNLNLELLKAGLAWHYKQFSTDKTYAEAEKNAREQKIGLWSNPNPIPPWEFRKKTYRKDANSPQVHRLFFFQKKFSTLTL